MSAVPAPKTFSFQDKLPRLPIPPLQETADRYLKTLRPLLSKAEFEASEKNVREFVKEGGLGHELQRRLQEVDRQEPNSWLERWWLALAYHGWRESVMINSNWYMLLRDHPETPKELLDGPRLKGQFTAFQVKRAAGLVTNMLNYKDAIENETLPVDMTRAGPLDMNQYRHVFGITRVPKAGCDVNVGSFPCRSTHIVILARDQIYQIDVLDSKTRERVPIADIESQIHTVIQDVSQETNVQPPIGLFSGLHRDKWADAHKYLEDLSSVNRDTFHAIETAIFAVSLDDYTVDRPIEAVGKNVFHAMNGHNRWFDKSISVCITADGRAGWNGEHSPCDALVPALIADDVVKHEPAKDPASAKRNATLRPPQKLLWKIDNKIVQDLEEAQRAIDVDIANSDMKILHYSKYGTDFIKKIGKSSPDAYMQMALQLTFYRIHGTFAPVYETASTRQFKHGRTETCRSLSVDSKAFIEGFEDTRVSVAQKYALLVKACDSHVKYLAVAGQGRGVDRHLLGLRMTMKPDEKAPIFSDPAYAKSQHWQLSTSGLFPGNQILATGFGAVYPDGYGMNYMLAPKIIKMGVESKVADKSTSSVKYTETLSAVLDDMGKMCMALNGDGGKAKL
ncbi:acyltransferase ChoActase/COT/CPT [Powellomyces hirtus]|nr:acyltransferase ChoActase/COT/CPT [Powellomyces hirtus]